MCGLASLSHVWYLGFRLSVVFGISLKVRRKNERESLKSGAAEVLSDLGLTCGFVCMRHCNVCAMQYQLCLNIGSLDGNVLVVCALVKVCNGI